MKRFGKVLVALLAVIVLISGCTMKEEFTIKVKEDKHVDMGIVIAYDKDFIDGLLKMSDQTIKSEDITDDMRWAYLEKDDNKTVDIEGGEVNRYQQDGYYGYVITKDIGLIDDLSTEDKNAERVNINTKDLDKAKLFIKDGNKYKSNLYIDKSSDDYKNMDSYKQYGANFEIFLTVELPSKALSNNATEVTNDGKTLKWNLLEAENIDYEFEIKDKKAAKGIVKVLAIIVVIAILVIALIVVIVALLSGNKNNTTATPVKEEKKEEPVVVEEAKEEVVEEKVVEEVKEEKAEPEKKPAAKKTATKKTATKKAVEKKAPAKKTEAKKPAAKKAPAKKTAEKKPAAKKTTTKKTTKKSK